MGLGCVEPEAAFAVSLLRQSEGVYLQQVPIKH